MCMPMFGILPACMSAASFCISSGADGRTEATSNSSFAVDDCGAVVACALVAVCPNTAPPASSAATNTNSPNRTCIALLHLSPLLQGRLQGEHPGSKPL